MVINVGAQGLDGAKKTAVLSVCIASLWNGPRYTSDCSSDDPQDLMKDSFMVV